MDSNFAIKKKLMFSKGDDLYFLSYNIVLILYGLQCICGDKILKDYRKLAFLIEFVSNRNLVLTLRQNKVLVNPKDRELFTRAYANGITRLKHIVRLLYTLENKQIIQLEREKDKNTINVCLKETSAINTLIDKELFSLELNNIRILKSTVKMLNILSFDTFLDKMFNNYGIETWGRLK